MQAALRLPREEYVDETSAAALKESAAEYRRTGVRTHKVDHLTGHSRVFRFQGWFVVTLRRVDGIFEAISVRPRLVGRGYDASSALQDLGRKFEQSYDRDPKSFEAMLLETPKKISGTFVRPFWDAVLRPHREFASRVEQAAAEDDDRAVDMIYEHIDELLRAGAFAQVDRLLEVVDVARLSPLHAIAFLTITFNAREALRSRAAYFSRVRASLVTRDDAEDLLAGLA